MQTCDCGAITIQEPGSSNETAAPESMPLADVAAPGCPPPIVVPVSNSNMHIIKSLVRRLVAARMELKRHKRIVRRIEAGERRMLCSTCGSWAWRTAEGTPPPDWAYAGQLVTGAEAYFCPKCVAEPDTVAGEPT